MTGRPRAATPNLGMSAGTSKITPLVAALAAPEEKRSRAPIIIGVALGALVLGGVGVVLAQKGAEAAPDPKNPAMPAESATAIRLGVKPVAPSAAASVAPPPASSDTKGPKLPPQSTLPAPALKATGAPHDPKTASTPAPIVHEPEPAPALEPAPPPQPTAAPAPKPEPAPPAPPPSFNPASCRATLGAPKSASGYNVKDLTLRGTDGAWSTCAKSSMGERPGAPIAGTVRIRFNDNKVFRGATCTGCTPALAQCVASSTGKTASVSFKGGDVTGAPEFDVPVTFSCE